MHSGGQPGGATANRSTAAAATTTAAGAAATGATAAASSPSQGLKTEASQNAGTAASAAAAAAAAAGAVTPKNKKRDRPSGDSSNSEPSKRERSLEADENEVLKLDAGKGEEIAGILDKDGGLSSCDKVEKLVLAMQQDRSEGGRKPADISNKRTLLAAAIAATDNHECLDRFVQLGGVPLLHDWLQEAHKGKPGDSEGCKDGNKAVDELLLTIVSALEKLPVDLDALRTCLVGKSVNNLRNHKNHEIKDKAKRLVETWKKRVDEEVNSTSEIKPAPLGHGSSSWSTNKVAPVGLNAVEPQAGVKSSASNGAGSCTTKYKQNSKDDKGSQSPSNGWGNHTVSPLTWKDDGKNSTSPSSGSKTNNSNGRVSAKALSALNPCQKDSTTGKPLTWRTEKGTEISVSPEACSHKLILRLPNPGRGSSASATGEVQGSSPNVAEQVSTSGVVEASDARHRSHSVVGQQQQQQQQQNDVEISVSREAETERTQISAENKSEASRVSAGAGTAVVPVSAASRISRNADAGRSTGVSEIDTVNQEATVERDAMEAGTRSDSKQEAGRKDTLDRANGGNCASSSSFTEMSVAQGGDTDVKMRGDESTSSAGVATDAENRSRIEQEGLGESPEPRQIVAQVVKRSEDSESPKPAVDQPSGEAQEREKRSSADVSSTQGVKLASFGNRGIYERRERHEKAWEDSLHSKGSAFDCKSSSEPGVRKNGAEQEALRKAAEFSSKLGDSRRNDSSEFVEDDALEVAQQIAKEVVEEMEDREKRPARDAAKLHKEVQLEADKQECVDVAVVKSPTRDVEVREPAQEDKKLKEDIQEKETECDEAPVSPLKAVENEKPDSPSPSARAAEDKQAEAPGTSRPDFDLNEGLAGEEGFKEVCFAPVLSTMPAASGPTTPIAVLSTTRGAFIPPESLMKGKAETGWRGSAATSAFRPAEPRRSLETQQTNTSEANPGKPVRAPLDIDLNVVDENVALDLSSFTSSSSKPKQAPENRVVFDLNCADESNDGMDVKADLSRKDGCGRGVTRDFDLNGPTMDDMGEEPSLVPQLNLRSSDNSVGTPSVTNATSFRDAVNVAPWFPQGNSFSLPAFPMVRAEAGYGQQFMNAGGPGGGAIHFNVDLYRPNGMTLATPAVAYPAGPQVATYPYAGFPFASNYSFNSSAAFPAPYVDAAAAAAAMASYPSAAAPSQLGGPMSRFIRPPHLMSMPEGGGGSSWTRPSLDLNTGPDSEAAGVEAGRSSAAHIAMNSSIPGGGGGGGGRVEDHLRGFRQVAPPPASGKRKEPEGGWEAFQAGYKQPAWC